jgi:hypothetical protein
MKYVDIRDLPPCSFSPQCLRLIDDLDMPAAPTVSPQLSYIGDLQDERELRKLRSHVPGCPTCSALLAEARRMRTQQRMMLYHFLVTNERYVPSTSGAIFEALRREQAQNEEPRRRRSRSQDLTLFPPVEQDEDLTLSPLPLRSRPSQHRSLFQNFLTLATVAAVILAALGLLNRVASQPGTASPASSSSHPNQQPVQQNPAAHSYGWDSVVIGITLLSATGVVKSFTFYNYNTVSDQMAILTGSDQPVSNVRMEGISQDGQSLLYASTDLAQHTMYSVYSPASGVRELYQLKAGLGGNAIWMDSEHVLVQNVEGTVSEVDISTGTIQNSWPIKASRLTFYHYPFLYFVGAENVDAGALYRLDLTQVHAVAQRVTRATPDTHFWFSIDGSTVFYANKGSSGKEGIYAVRSDGTDARLLRTGPGIPIGYAADNALMLLQQVGRKLQVIQMGATSSQPEQVVFSNAAPGATSLCGASGVVLVIAICDQNVALAPYGHGLLLNAYYADGSHGLIYDNLATGQTHLLRRLPGTTSVQLPGWSKMSVSPAGTPLATRAGACLCA